MQNYRIFLCHASEDKATIRELSHRLMVDGFNPWLDEVDLIPGQDWPQEVRQAIRNSLAVLICLSRNSTKTGFVNKEIKYALDIADEQPEGTIFLIPVKLERCTLPQSLRNVQWVDLFAENGYEKLTKALRVRVFQTIGANLSLMAYVEDLIESKEFPNLTAAIRVELANDLYRRLDDFSTARIIAALSDDDVQEFEQMLSERRSEEELQEFVSAHIQNFRDFMTAILVEFRLRYLGILRPGKE